MADLPLWIYLVFSGIIFSGIMTLLSAKTDKEVEQSFIEKEGEVYMKRIEEERRRRRQLG